MTPPNREDLLAAVERSPQAVTVHDRVAWVGVFTDDARVEDPVGSSPHIGHEQIYGFYDTFIGPREIKFRRDLDIVNGRTVVRDLELEVAMGRVTMYIPAFLRYDLREVNGEWKVAVLRAYWELPAMMGQFLRTGSRATAPALQLSKGLLTNQGLRGTAGFMTGFRRVGARHKKLVGSFLGAVAQGDKATASRALSHTATITLGDNDAPDVLDLTELVEQLDGAGWSKMIGAGSTITASLATDHGRGVVFADVAWRGNQINQIRYFPG